MRIADGQIRPEDTRSYFADGRWTATTFNEVLDQHAAAAPDRVAVADGRSALTYSDYRLGALRVAALLLELGLTREDVVAVQLPNCLEFPLAVNGASRVGIPFCQYHPGFRATEVELVLRFTGAAAVIVPATFKDFDYVEMVRGIQPRLPKLRHVVVVADEVPDGLIGLRQRIADPAAPVPTEEALAARRPHGNDLMRVAFTSGTTGDPKAVMHTFNTSRGSIADTVRAHGLTADSVTLLYQPVGLNLGLQETFRALVAGSTIIYHASFNPRQVLQTIQDQRVTHMASAPAGLISLLAEPDFTSFDLSSLKLVGVGGASCPASVIREWAERAGGSIVQNYGMLEMGSGTLMAPGEPLEDVVRSVGRPHPAITLKVADENDKALPAGEAGEIMAKGPSVCIGYYENPDANSRSFTADGWLRSGDIGVLDEWGYLSIIGRKKEMIIRAGANIYPAEIEDALIRHPSIRDCGVVGLPHPRVGEIAVACVVLSDNCTLTFEDMAAFLGSKIARYKIPERLEIVSELPRTPTGKIQKPRLSELLTPTQS